MFFSNETKVTSTASPTTFTVDAKEPNVTQYGWTKADVQNYNQLIQYVDEVKQIKKDTQIIFEYVLATKEQIDEVIHRVDGVDEIYNNFLEKYTDFEQKYWNIIEQASFVGLAYADILDIKQDLQITASEINGKVTHVDNQISHVDSQISYVDSQIQYVDSQIQVAEDHAADAADAALQAEDYYNQSKDLYEDLRHGQVYRGIWNPQSGAYPDPQNTNSTWDVVLPDGVNDFEYDSVRWNTGDRLVYVKDTTTYQKISASSGVTSVNGQSGAVTITATGIGAVATTGDQSIAGKKTFTGSVDLGTGIATYEAVPVASNQVANKLYVDYALNQALNTIDVSHLVTLDTVQSITGAKVFNANLSVSGAAANFASATSVNVPTPGVRPNATNKGYVDDAIEQAVGGIAEIPFPDVWIPFNDGLQMLAGYGDEVKVGPVTVGKYATFSRASQKTYIDKSGVSQTADINEPCFTRDGLTITPDTVCFIQSENNDSNAELTIAFNNTAEVKTGISSGGKINIAALVNNNGHIRNFRIWHKALSDAQLKMITQS